MLNWLKIKNLALVEDAEIEFTPGLNIISGETGAGKSVIIGAVSLLLGKRSDKSIIRRGETRCELSAGILLSPALKKHLAPIIEYHSIPLTENELLLRRVITLNSGRNFINDTNVTLTVLTQLSEYLVDFHGPNHNLSLLKPSTQLELIDRFGNLESLRKGCAELYNDIKVTEKELEELQSQLPDAIEAEYLKRIIGDVDKTSPMIDEDIELSAKHKIAANAQNIISLTSNAKYQLYDAEDSLLNRFGSLNRELEDLAKIDSDNADKFTVRINTITEEIKELAFDLEEYASGTELDEYELAHIEDRLNEVTALKRKYGPTIENVLDTSNKAKERLDKLENFEGLKNRIEQKFQQLNITFSGIASKLSKERKKSAHDFSEATKIKLNKLGFFKS